MAWFWELYREYCNKNSGKNCIIDLKRKDAFVSIKVICNCKDIDPYIEYKFLNEMSNLIFLIRVLICFCNENKST